MNKLMFYYSNIHPLGKIDSTISTKRIDDKNVFAKWT